MSSWKGKLNLFLHALFVCLPSITDGVFNNNRILPAGFADTARSLQSVIPAQDPFSEFQVSYCVADV